MLKQKPRPVATVKAGTRYRSGPQSTFVTVTYELGTCTIELTEHFGSLKVHLHVPKGHIHLCAPLKQAPHGQCMWSTKSDYPAAIPEPATP